MPSLDYAFIRNRPFQIRFWKLRKSYLHEVRWGFFNQSRKSSSPQNSVNNLLVRPEISTIPSFSSAIKLKNTHIQSSPHYFWTTFKRHLLKIQQKKYSFDLKWPKCPFKLTHLADVTETHHLDTSTGKSQKICSLVVWWCFVCDPMCQIRKKSSLFGTSGHNFLFSTIWVKFVVFCDYLNPAKGMVLRRACDDFDLYASDTIGKAQFEKSIIVQSSVL